MTNDELAAIFYEMGDILEMQNVQWKPRAYRQAARAIESAQDVSEIFKKGGIKALEEIPGVGEGIAQKIVEFLKTGKVKQYEKLKKTVPGHIDVLMKIPGMGSKKVKKLNKILKVTTVDQLEKACKQHKVAAIEGFGKQSEQDILDGIAMMKQSKGKIPYKQAITIARKLIAQINANKVSIAGSLRRKKALVRDIDILASSRNSKKVIGQFIKIKDIQRVLAKGSTKASVVLKSGVQVDLRVVKAESWGAALFYFTGSKNYDIEMRKIAIKKGYKLSEYGLFENGKMIAGKTEQQICKKLGVKYLKPEERGR